MDTSWTNYEKDILDGFRNLRNCDNIPDQVILVCEEKEFPANRTMLMVGCIYFKTFFNSNFVDSNAPRIVLPEVSSYAMNYVLDFIHCKRPEIPDDMLKFLDVFKAAQFFQLSSLELMYLEKFEEEISPENFFSLWEMVKGRAEYSKLSDLIVNNVSREINEYVGKEIHWLDYEQFSTLLSELSKDKSPAYKVIHMITRWVSFNPKERQPMFVDLFQHFVILEMLSVDELITMVMEQCFMDVKHLLQDEIECRLNKLSTWNSKIVFISRRLKNDPNVFLTSFDVITNKWSVMCDVKRCIDIKLSWQPVAFHKGAVFLDSKGIVCKLQLWSFEKTILPFPDNLKQCLLLVSVGEVLYCIADRGVHGSTSFILKYEDDEVCWVLLSSCDKDFDFTKKASATSLNGCIYFYEPHGGNMIVYDISENMFKEVYEVCKGELQNVCITAFNGWIYIPVSCQKFLKYNPETGVKKEAVISMKMLGLWGVENHMLVLNDQGLMFKFDPSSNSLTKIEGAVLKLGFETKTCMKAMFTNHVSEISD